MAKQDFHVQTFIHFKKVKRGGVTLEFCVSVKTPLSLSLFDSESSLIKNKICLAFCWGFWKTKIIFTNPITNKLLNPTTFLLLISHPPKHLEVPSWTFFNNPFNVDFKTIQFFMI